MVLFKKNMNLTFVITGLGVGGAEKQVALLADYFSSIKNYKVSIISLTNDNSVMPKDPSIRIFYLGMNKNKPFSILKGFINGYRVLKELPIQIVHSHMFHANIFSRILRLILPIEKLICTAHNSNEGGSLRMKLYRYTDFICDITTNVSIAASQALIQKKAFFPEKNLTVYNAINTNYFKFSEYNRVITRKELELTSEKLILNVGRLEEQKDHETLIRAFKIIHTKDNNFRLILIGEGTKRKEIEELIISLGLKDKIKLLGIKEDIPRYLSAADFFILSSKYEGFALVIAEAMACECLCVSTKCEGPPEIIEDTGNIIVPICSSEKIAEAILQLDQYPKMKQDKIKNDSRQRIANFFSIESIMAKWESIYNK